VTVFDGALPRPLVNRLRAAVEALGDRRLAATYQQTFWFPLSATPSSLVELAVPLLFPRLPAARARGVIGVEWWLSRMRTSNVQVDFHRDRDNALFASTGRTVSPRTGSVLYLNECRGGLLAVTREPTNPRNPALAPTRHDFDLLAPRENRFAFFEGQLTHGVLDSENQLPGTRRPKEKGLRLAVAINWWHKRPTSVPRFAESRALRVLAAP
jgi:hypothetical protein